MRLNRHGLNPWVGKILWRRKWQPTLVFLPGKAQEERNLAGYSPCSRKESDRMEHAHMPILLSTEKMPLFSLTISYPFYLFSFDLTHEQMREPVYVLEKLVLRRI